MRAVLFGLLIVSASASHALAYGAIAAGDNGGTLNFTWAYNERTYDAANALSLRRCQEQGLTNCTVRWNFKNICISVGRGGSNGGVEGHGDTPDDAREQMNASCTDAGERSCSEAILACDRAELIAGIEEDAAAEIPAVTTPPTMLQQLTSYIAYIVLPRTFDVLAGLIVLSLLIWIFISIVWTTPLPVLKERFLISAWISGPAVLRFFLWPYATKFGPFFQLAIYSLSLWTYAFAALIIGGRLRRLLSPKWKPPSPLSLPLATLAFTITAGTLLWLFYWYVISGELIGCIFAPKSPANPCWLMERDNVSAALVALVALVACGAVLPADSNLVLANNRLGTLIRHSLANFRRKRREKAKQMLMKSEETGSYPVPALYTPTVSDVMRLKLKRSQRSSLLGKIIFVLNARMELTQEELDLVRGSRLLLARNCGASPKLSFGWAARASALRPRRFRCG
jgi:hypothetical protein